MFPMVERALEKELVKLGEDIGLREARLTKAA